MRRLIIAAVAGLLAFGLPPLSAPNQSSDSTSIARSLSAAEATANSNRRVARRTARRTSRRVNRRHDYYRALPGGCARAGLYWRCGSVYYNEVVDNGATVYVIVTP
ncbi:MAG: hypothetical protein AAF409_12055 [Pseudomonadota bacterium]